jgi:Mrp family chromosome partitioning ATPase
MNSNHANEKSEELRSINGILRVAETAMESDHSDLSIAQLATESSRVKGLTGSYLPLIGICTGALFALFLVACKELTDAKFRTRAEVNAAYSLPVIAQIPELRFLTATNAEDRLQDFARNLGDKIQSICERSDCKRIGFISGTGQEGKSTVAFLYARHLKKMGFKTCYIDFTQSENPFMNIGLSSRATLEEFCKEGADLDQLVIKGKVDSIKAGEGKELVELLQSGKGDLIWNLLNEKYDKIVVESPSLLGGECGLNLCKKCDVTLFVIGANIVMKSVVDSCFREFETAKFYPAGIIMNRIKPAYIDDPLVKQRWKANRRWFG